MDGGCDFVWGMGWFGAVLVSLVKKKKEKET